MPFAALSCVLAMWEWVRVAQKEGPMILVLTHSMPPMEVHAMHIMQCGFYGCIHASLWRR